MKKEIIYITVPIIMVLFGIFYKSIYLSETINKTHEIVILNNESNAKYARDSLVQINISQIKKMYETNKRDNRTYGEVIADLLKITEGILQKSEIQYKGNDINQEFDEVKDFKSGTSIFTINLFFSTDYTKLLKFIQSIEKSEYLINLTSLELTRSRSDQNQKALQAPADSKDEQPDEFNENFSINVKAKLEFVKFL